MIEVVFLGTSAATPSALRGLSSHMVLHRQYRFLIDCGEGTQRQILRSGLGFKRLDKVLITHSHLDHILGLGGLVSTLTRWEALEALEIYAGQAALDRIHDLIYKVVLRGATPPVEIKLTPVRPGDVLFQDDRLTVSAFPVIHRGPDCYGYLFEEKARRPFLAERANELGVPFGPERSQLVREEPVTLADGRVIQPDDVLGPPEPGLKYVHIGDIGRVRNVRAICRDATALTIEATYTEEEAQMARTFGHMTAAGAARLARETGVGTLLLTHISRRHFERDIRNEARAIFPDTFVARDFDHFRISRAGTERLNREPQQNG